MGRRGEGRAGGAGVSASLEFNPRDSVGRRCAATAATTATEGRRRSRRVHGKAPAREAAREELEVEAAREELEVEAAREEPAVAATSEQRAAATATMMAREGEGR